MLFIYKRCLICFCAPTSLHVFFCSKNVKKVLIHFSLYCVWIKLPWSNTYCIDIVNKTQTWMLIVNTRTNSCPQIYTSCIVMNNSLNILVLFMNKNIFLLFKFYSCNICWQYFLTFKIKYFLLTYDTLNQKVYISKNIVNDSASISHW